MLIYTTTNCEKFWRSIAAIIQACFRCATRPQGLPHRPYRLCIGAHRAGYRRRLLQSLRPDLIELPVNLLCSEKGDAPCGTLGRTSLGGGFPTTTTTTTKKKTTKAMTIIIINVEWADEQPRVCDDQGQRRNEYLYWSPRYGSHQPVVVCLYNITTINRGPFNIIIHIIRT